MKIIIENEGKQAVIIDGDGGHIDKIEYGFKDTVNALYFIQKAVKRIEESFLNNTKTIN
jgi:hypothetical protein